MYIVKVCKDKQVLDIKHYAHFENAVAAIADKTIFKNISVSDSGMLGNPKICCGSDTNGVADDFVFRYDNGICVYVGTILIEDTEKRKENA